MRISAFLLFISSGFLLQAQADTVSETVGVVNVSVTANRSATVSNPLVFEPGAFDDDGLAEILAADGANGDFLHVWTGNSFNTYTLLNGIWNVFDTAIPIPATRLIAAGGTGNMISRKSAGVTGIQFIGKVATATTASVQVPGESWALISFPFPKSISLNFSTWSDSNDGDLIKIWDLATQAWLDFARDAGVWTGNDAGSQMIDIGTAFLYYNSSSQLKTINFQKPF